MIIIKDKYGQLCNRLWAYSPLITKAIETGEKIEILNFYDYYKYFENLEAIKNIYFHKKAHILHTLYIRIPEKYMPLFKPLRKEFWNLKDKERLLFLSSWKHKDVCEELNTPMLKKLFMPVKSSVTKVNSTLQKQRKQFDVIVGVHIRKGDYETFRNGIFYYTDEVYAGFMKQVKEQFPKDKRVGFLICSNSAINKNNFAGMDIFQLDSPNLIEDLYALSNCDYLMGPPSTYSMWASFVGEKPLKFLMGKNEEVKLDKFSPIVAENTFASGEILDITSM